MRHVVEVHVLPDTYSGGRSDGPAATKQLLLALVDILITTTLLNNNITEQQLSSGLDDYTQRTIHLIISKEPNKRTALSSFNFD